MSFAKGERPKFILGDTVITSGANATLDPEEIPPILKKHMLGDWGELCDEDKQANEEALTGGGRLLSKYTSASGQALYVITEADRSVTTILLPEEY